MHLRVEQLGIPSTVPKRLPRRRHRRAPCSYVLDWSGTSSCLVKRGDATAADERLAQVPAARSRSSSESTTRGPSKAIPGAAPSRSIPPSLPCPPVARKLSPSLMVGHRRSPCHRGGSLVSGTRKSTRSKPSAAPSDVTSDRHATNEETLLNAASLDALLGPGVKQLRKQRRILKLASHYIGERNAKRATSVGFSCTNKPPSRVYPPGSRP